MKRIKRTVAVVTLLSLVFCFAPTVSASAVYDTIVPESTEISRLTYSDGAYLADVYGKYTKGDKVMDARSLSITATKKAATVAVAGGDSVYGKYTLSQIVGKYNTEGKRVIGAVNADFFSTSTGLPLGVQINGGKIFATNDAGYDKETGRVSVGINADGSAVFDVPEFEITVSIDGYELTADRINSFPNWYEKEWEPVVVLTSDYGAKTHWTTTMKNPVDGTDQPKPYDVIVLKADGDLMLNDDTTCHYDAYLQNQTEPVPIEKGKIYIVAKAGYFDGFTPPQPSELPTPEEIANGAVAELDDISYISVMETTGKWDNVVTAFGAGNLLVSGGVVRYESTYDPAIKNTKTSRTAFGVKEDGSYVLYTAERNRAGTVAGTMLDSVAQAMKDMGCVYAVNLDGGGSTTIAADTGDGIRIKNHLQEGAERKIANAILLLSDEKAPVIVEDFETDKTFTPIEQGGVAGAVFNTSTPYTAGRALEIGYTLTVVKQRVGIEFEPINIKDYSTLMMAVDMNGSGVTLEARLKNEKGVFTRPIAADGDGYRRTTVDVRDADELVGFSLVYKLGGKNTSSVLIDRIVGYGDYQLSDDKVPEMSVSIKDGKLNVFAYKAPFSAGLDPGGAEVTINGGELLRGYSIDLSGMPTDRINRAKTYAVDVIGNRTVAYNLFKADGYATPAPFADMNDKKWDALALRYCYENNIISGFNEGGQLLAKGSNNVTRAQFCVMIVNQKKLDLNNYLNVVLPYEDAAAIPKWALPYVRAAFAEGIMTGTKTETGIAFMPESNITRQEAASALDRLIDKDTRLTRTVVYGDEADIAKWAKKFVTSASTQGLFEGDKNGNFYPNNNLTRSESAVLMSKL